MGLTLTSKAFAQGEAIPEEYAHNGRNVSPPLRWDDPPSGTKSFAVVCVDPDAPHGTFAHWVLFNMPASSRELLEAVPQEASFPDGAMHGSNDFGKMGYGGPEPPPGNPHRYVFTLYALDNMLGIPAGASREEFLAAIKGHILAESPLTGTYAR